MVRLGSFVEQLADLGGLRVHMSPILRQHAVAVQRATSGLPLWTGYLLLDLAANAGAGFMEEIGYRGYVLRNLGGRVPLWLAVPLTAFMFAIVAHFNRLTPFFVLVATVVAVLFAITRLAAGAIWFAIGLHWSFDASQNYLFGLGHEPSLKDKTETTVETMRARLDEVPVTAATGVEYSDDRVVGFAVGTVQPPPDAVLQVRYQATTTDTLSVFEATPLVRSLQTLVSRSRPLRATDALLHGDATLELDSAVFVDRGRVTGPKAELDTLSADVGV
jgi:hypothetical protein